MKRVVIAIVMLIFAVSISTLSAYLFDKKINQLITSVESIRLQPDSEKINDVITDWASAKSFFKFVTVHETVNEIEISFNSLKIATDDNSIKEICSEIIILLDILEKSESSSAENIF